MMARNRLSIAICADERLSLCGAMVLYSAARNIKAGFHIDAYVIDTGIDRQSRERFEKVFAKISHVSLCWLKPDLNSIKDLPVASWVSVAANARLLLPTILPEKLQRILYLDSDMIVLGDISNIFTREFNGEYIFAVRDAKYPYVSQCQASRILINQGLDPLAPYFNSGLMLIDIPNWKHAHVSAKVMDILISIGEQFTHRDQDALNIIMYKKWGMLDPRWNVLPHLFTTSEVDKQFIAKEARIIHYTGKEKPFSQFNTHPERGVFLKYVYQSGWFGLGEWIRWRAHAHVMKYHSRFLRIKNSISYR